MGFSLAVGWLAAIPGMGRMDSGGPGERASPAYNRTPVLGGAILR
jgi:hypothetical protein